MAKEKEKNVTLTVRITASENDAIRKAADTAGVRLSSWIRKRLTGGTP